MIYKFKTGGVDKDTNSYITLSKDKGCLTVISGDFDDDDVRKIHYLRRDEIDAVINSLTKIKNDIEKWDSEPTTCLNVYKRASKLEKDKIGMAKSRSIKKNNNFLKKIHYMVLEHLDDSNFGNGQLAEKMQMSESQLFRRIKALTNHSTGIHIRSIRLQVAKELILNSRMNISEIAYCIGFNDPSYFTRTFLKEFGCTPSDLR